MKYLYFNIFLPRVLLLFEFVQLEKKLFLLGIKQMYPVLEVLNLRQMTI